MLKYFTDIPICPNCFKPALNNNLEQLDINESIIRCSSCGNYFRNSVIISQNDEFNFSFPIFSEVKLNKIESSYVDWISKGNMGKFLVTWPWDEVKFIPILIAQYLYDFPKNKLVIFCNSDYFESDKFSDESISNFINSLYHVNCEKSIENSLKLGINDVFVKYDLNNIPSIHDDLNHAVEYCFNNKFELMPCFEDIEYCFIKNEDDLNINLTQNQLFFIDESILSENIIDFIETIGPDLIISTNLDALYGKNRFGKGNPIYNLFRLETDMLLFSVELNQRNTHNIGQDRYFLKNWNIIPHTWDYNIILNKIEKEDKNELSFFSSSFSEVHEYNVDLNIELIKCEELEKIESTFNVFEELFPYDAEEVSRTLTDLMKTPLHINGFHNDKRVLKRNIAFEYLFNLIYNIDLEKWKELTNIFDEVYDFHGSGKNPIFDLLIELINKNQLNTNEFVVIVHSWDIKGTKCLLEDIFGKNDILVTSWSKLDEDIGKYGDEITYGISTLFPTYYDVANSPLKKVDIICSPHNFKRFDVYKKNKFTDNGLRPVYLLNEYENSPELLKNCLVDINVPKEFYDELNKINDLGFGRHKNRKLKQFNYSKIKRNNNAVLVLNDASQGMFLKFNRVIYVLNEDGEMEDIIINGKNYSSLINNNILISNHEYHSRNRDFLKFVIEQGQYIELSEGPFKWRGFKDLIENMFEWVDLLNKIIQIEAKNNLENYEGAKLKIAKELSNLDLTAKDEKYILNTWLEDPQPLDTELGEVDIYESERPHTEDDLSKIYKWVSDNYPQFARANLASQKCFAASRELKRIRKKFIKNGSFRMDSNLEKLNFRFKNFIKDNRKFFTEFNISSVERVKIKHEVSPFELVNNPYDYLN